MSRTSEARAVRRRMWAIIALVAISGLAGGYSLANALDERDAARAEAGAIAGQSGELVECVNGPQVDCSAEADRLEEAVENADAIPGPAGAAGLPGIAGLDGRDGVDGEDGAIGPRGPQGPRGLPGVPGARGVAGQDGEDGVNGVDGAPGVDGAQGPPGPAGEPGARGPAGETGATGPAGSDGRGIQSVECDTATEQYVVTYTDGTRQSIDGSDCVANTLVDP